VLDSLSADQIAALPRDVAEVLLGLQGLARAVERSQLVVELGLDGRVLDANAAFLAAVGYEREELRGRHHRELCRPELVASRDYEVFWEELRAGSFLSGEYERVRKDGGAVWLQATYTPVLDAEGVPLRVVKVATDITAQKLAAADHLGKITALDRAQAVVEFDLDGRVLAANDNFLAVMGYALSEVQGKHHRMFCDAEHASSAAYSDFWDRLRAGEFHAGEYKRLGKQGREVWIQATYNPILGPDGLPCKVVKFASDVTAERLEKSEVAARVAAADRTQAVIEFDLDGTIITANDNFLRTMGYSLREIVGKHHSMFCSDEYMVSEEYRDFWLRLSKGEYIGGRFERVGKFGRTVHLQAAYNPILDLDGRPMKVVKYAYDITAEVTRERRASSFAETVTTTVEQLSASIAEITECSASASDLAAEATDAASSGAAAVREAIAANGSAQRSADAIKDIVRVMGDIANQTNLLAFNASIEAARAGEHGVGFSLVAGEVRGLAERSFEAAQQIGRLLEESVAQVERSGTVAAQAERAFAELLDGFAQTTSAMARISEAVTMQQSASDAVANRITDLTGGPSRIAA
jgi:methyl-accepting chemotaxis protein